METTTPPTPPSPVPVPPSATWPREPRRLAAGRGLQWWSEGWRIFMAAPLQWLGMFVVMVLINVALHWIPIVGSLGTTIVNTIFVGGLLLGCHGLAQGRPLEFAQLFAAFRNDRLGPLAILGLIALGVGLVIALVLGVLVMGAGAAGMLTGTMAAQDAGVGMMTAMAGMGAAALVGSLIGLVIGVLFYLAWWYAPALVAINRAAPVDALKASFRASTANLGAMTVFLLVFVLLALVASIPFGLGWLVLGPVAFGAGYASWREVFGD
ncbi:MAG TPA: BPSS1780 family membrane protein [Casimicrobiaceae bacterium]|nr:BPSS1780 family membrane protein [Casimicrobiaceae bacterium]